MEEPGDVHGRGGNGADHHLHDRQPLGLPERGRYRLSVGPGFLARGDAALRELRLRHCRGPRQGPGRCLAEDAARHSGPPPPRGWNRRAGGFHRTPRGRQGGSGRGRRDPRRRRNHRRRGFHRRIGDHRRVGPRDPRGRRGPLGRHGRHAGPFGPDRRRDHRQPRRFLPRPHDRPGGRGHPPTDAQ